MQAPDGKTSQEVSSIRRKMRVPNRSAACLSLILASSPPVALCNRETLTGSPRRFVGGFEPCNATA